MSTDLVLLTDARFLRLQDLIAAATGTSSETLEWTMAELVANPRVMAKLQDEIARVAGDEATIAEADLNRMEYLKAVFKEVLRLHPPAPLLVPQESTTPALVRGYEIPARTALFVNAWAIGRDPAAWDAPEEFRPERFVGGGPAADFRGTDYQLIPFGAGRRMCPGINFALPVVELALASLLRHFNWELPAGMRPADLDMGEAPALTTPPRVPLVLVPRCKTLAQPAN
ncbi:cytochrome P450 [Panicum miliaceum]|uniref:Cytochrome P450 n=1 Tax=Panicum miliaceum TaxID=4540 RepID=A0A3L6RZJ5_PANMI|nr:cytochrome P450 [Panicum miliaceum]